MNIPTAAVLIYKSIAYFASKAVKVEKFPGETWIARLGNHPLLEPNAWDL